MKKKVEKYVKLEDVIAVIREYREYSERMCDCLADDLVLSNQYFGQKFACSHLESLIMAI